MVTNISTENSIVDKYLLELRDVNIQKDRYRFRNNLKRIAYCMGHEISKSLDYKSIEVETPMGIAPSKKIINDIVIGNILRAGLPLFDGLMEIFDDAEAAFISAYRRHHKNGTFEINMPYTTCPSLDGKVLILADPMLATGASIVDSLKSLQNYGKPKHIHIVTVIASQEGLEYVKRLYPNTHIWTAAIDEELTAKSYIVPGLGDAGDLAFGSKLQE